MGGLCSDVPIQLMEQCIFFQQPDHAKSMSRITSDYLAYIFRNTSEMVPVTAETNHCENYLKILLLRYPEKFTYYFEVHEEVENAVIFPFLIQVFEEIHRRAPNSLLVLVGDGALRPDIEKQAAQAGLTDSVVFMGNVDNVAELMMAADAMVFPSKYEGFPTVLLEAQAAGLDAFVSDSITKEIVLTGRIHPLSLEQGAQAWADAILQTRRAPNRAADNAAIRERYDVSVAAARLTQIYTQS